MTAVGRMTPGGDIGGSTDNERDFETVCFGAGLLPWVASGANCTVAFPPRRGDAVLCFNTGCDADALSDRCSCCCCCFFASFSCNSCARLLPFVLLIVRVTPICALDEELPSVRGCCPVDANLPALML